MTNTTHDDDYKKQFAADVLQAVRSGHWPLPDAERIVTALCEMTITLSDANRQLRELCAAKQEAADIGIWLINHPDVKRKKIVGDA